MLLKRIPRLFPDFYLNSLRFPYRSRAQRINNEIKIAHPHHSSNAWVTGNKKYSLWPKDADQASANASYEIMILLKHSKKMEGKMKISNSGLVWKGETSHQHLVMLQLPIWNKFWTLDH